LETASSAVALSPPLAAEPAAEPVEAENPAPVTTAPRKFKGKAAPKARKIVSAAKAVAPKPVAAKPLAAKPAPAKPVLAKPAHVKPVAAKVSVAKVSVTKAPGAKISAARPIRKPVAETPQPVFSFTSPLFADLSSNPLFKDITMDMSANFGGLQTAMTEAQAKAKAAFEKSTALFGEVAEFTKGNVEAVVQSGKILAENVQEIGGTMVSEGRTAFETATSDIKELAAAKSPTDFLKLQSDLMRKNFDSAVALGSKNSETMLKLMTDVFAPISGRVSLAVEKARQTASF